MRQRDVRHCVLKRIALPPLAIRSRALRALALPLETRLYRAKQE